MIGCTAHFFEQRRKNKPAGAAQNIPADVLTKPGGQRILTIEHTPSPGEG